MITKAELTKQRLDVMYCTIAAAMVEMDLEGGEER